MHPAFVVGRKLRSDDDEDKIEEPTSPLEEKEEEEELDLDEHRTTATTIVKWPENKQFPSPRVFAFPKPWYYFAFKELVAYSDGSPFQFKLSSDYATDQPPRELLVESTSKQNFLDLQKLLRYYTEQYAKQSEINLDLSLFTSVERIDALRFQLEKDVKRYTKASKILDSMQSSLDDLVVYVGTDDPLIQNAQHILKKERKRNGTRTKTVVRIVENPITLRALEELREEKRSMKHLDKPMVSLENIVSLQEQIRKRDNELEILRKELENEHQRYMHLNETLISCQLQLESNEQEIAKLTRSVTEREEENTELRRKLQECSLTTIIDTL